jgi:hypothetical protein
MSYHLPNQRPKAPPAYLQDWSAARLTCTRTRVKQEYCTCDNYKVILLMCEQLMFIDRLQKEDILAIVRQDLKRRPANHMATNRPSAPSAWWANWSSDDFYTQTEARVEYFAEDCFKVIFLMCLQLRHYDRLSNKHILAVIEEDINRHFVEEDIAEENIGQDVA